MSKFLAGLIIGSLMVVAANYWQVTCLVSIEDHCVVRLKR